MFKSRYFRGAIALGIAATFALTAAVGEVSPAVAEEEGPVAVRQGDWILDATARGNVTYQGTVNVGSFQQDGLLTYDGHQYTAWFGAKCPLNINCGVSG